ncbi:MAG: tRNA lysidine(34) synthetase TilS [Mesorhizobium sp.]|nr:tRNA lysidine(34) synthetase TilS [Mesorhizobium sp.]
MHPSTDRAPQAGELFAQLHFHHHGKVIIAVSGGSDSLALLDLAVTALAGTDTQLVAVTVDHRLRPESAAEARAVGDICRELGVRHLTLSWKNPDIVSGGLIARAREARYRLLAEAAEELGARIVLLGHTADDQAETVAMRAGRRQDHAEGWDRGGAGMARATLFDGRIWLVRPLLGERRQDLRAHLSRRGLDWIDDPTNGDMRYERPRIRKRLTEAQAAPLLLAATEATKLRAAMGREAARLIERHVGMPAPGLFRLDPDMLARGDKEPALYAFRSLLAVAGGQEHLPNNDRSAALFLRLAEREFRATLSRTRVEVHRQGIFLCRESRSLPRLDARPQIVWDGRHRLRIAGMPPGSFIAPAGAEAAGEAARAYAEAPERLARIALSAEPQLLYQDGTKVSPGIAFERLVSPFARFLGEYDLELAAALAGVCGTALPRTSPFARHIAS